MFYEKRCSKKFRKIRRKTAVPESFFKIKLQDPGTGVFQWILRNFSPLVAASKGYHKPVLKCFYLLLFSVKNGRCYTTTENCCLCAHILQIVTGINSSKSCNNSNGRGAEKIERFVMFYTNWTLVTTNLQYILAKRDLSLVWNRIERRSILFEQNPGHDEKAWTNSKYMSTICW